MNEYSAIAKRCRRQSRSAAVGNRNSDTNYNGFLKAEALPILTVEAQGNASTLESQLSNSDIEKAILTLEDLGFDTLPFGLEFNPDIDNNSEA